MVRAEARLRKLEDRRAELQGPPADAKEAKRRASRESRRARHKRRCAARLRKRAEDMVADMHWRLAKWLCNQADVVVLPKFNAGEMVLKKNKAAIDKGAQAIKSRRARKIGKKTVKKMLGLAHSAFRARLKSKAEEYGTRVVEVREDSTSKTCGQCGNIHKDLGWSKVFKCPKCSWTADRDCNGARNIFIRFLVDKDLVSHLKARRAACRGPPCGL